VVPSARSPSIGGLKAGAIEERSRRLRGLVWHEFANFESLSENDPTPEESHELDT
jgi:hypothetical protein